MMEQVIHTLKDQGVHRHCFDSPVHTLRVIDDWIAFYNRQQPHPVLNMMTSEATDVVTLTA